MSTHPRLTQCQTWGFGHWTLLSMRSIFLYLRRLVPFLKQVPLGTLSWLSYTLPPSMQNPDSTQPHAHMYTGVTFLARGQPIPKEVSGLFSYCPISKALWPAISFDVLFSFFLVLSFAPCFSLMLTGPPSSTDFPLYFFKWKLAPISGCCYVPLQRRCCVHFFSYESCPCDSTDLLQLSKCWIMPP